MTNSLEQKNRLIHGSRRRSMSMVEIVFSIMLVGGLLVAALNTLGVSVQARQITSNKSLAVMLAQDLISEIMQKEYRENREMVTWGREIGELDGTRINFDDVDDYNNWAASPPQSMDGTVLPNLPGWQRSVEVFYVLPDDLETTTTENTGVKRITVTINKDGDSITRLTCVKTSSESISKSLRSNL